MKTTVNEKRQTELTYKLKYIFCQDNNCPTCTKGKGHGPYWHASFEIDGKKQTVFLGKEFKPLDIDPDNKNQNPSEETKTAETNNNAQNVDNNGFKFSDQWKQKSTNNTLNSWHHLSKQKTTTDLQSEPPSKLDFERDLKTLKRTFRPKNLKSLYRKLTKKYHPDKYPGFGHINGWMAEINGQYHELKKAAGL